MRVAIAIAVLLTALGGAMAEDAVAVEDFDKLWNYSDPAATEKAFRKLIPEAKKKGVDLHAQLLTQIARTKGLRGEFDDAHEILGQVEKMLTDECVIARVRYHLERGRAFNSAGKKQNAVSEFKRALKLAEAAKAEFHMVDAVHMLGIADDPTRKLEWNVAAIKLAEEVKDEKARGWLGPLYNNTGWAFHDLEDYDRALEYFMKSLAYRKERKQIKQIRIAKWTVARCLRSMGRHKEALTNQRALLEEYEKDGHRDGFVYEEIGENLWAMGNKRESRSWFRGAYELLKDVGWLQRSEPKRLASLKERGGIADDADEGGKK